MQNIFLLLKTDDIIYVMTFPLCDLNSSTLSSSLSLVSTKVRKAASTASTPSLYLGMMVIMVMMMMMTMIIIMKMIMMMYPLTWCLL